MNQYPKNLDNVYADAGCPSMMSDGRFGTNYEPNIYTNELLKMDNKLVRDDDYRLFLQKNAVKLMEEEWKRMSGTKCRVKECTFKHDTARVLSQSFPQESASHDETLQNEVNVDTAKNSCNHDTLKDYRLM
jgi:hypothetical protein